MNCEKALDLIEEYIMGELDLETRSMLAKHLQECSDCNTEYIETEEVIRGLHNLKSSKSIESNVLYIGKKAGRRRKLQINMPSVAAALFFVMFLLASSVIAFPTFAQTIAPDFPVVKQLLETQKDYKIAMQENHEIKKLNQQIEQENQELKRNNKEIGGYSIELQTSEYIGDEDNNKVQKLVIDFIKSQYKGDLDNIKAMCTDEFKEAVDEMKDSILLNDKGNMVFTQISNAYKVGDLYSINVRLNDESDIPDYQINFELKKVNENFYVSYVGYDI